MNKKWDDKQTQFLIDNVNTYSDEKMALELQSVFNKVFTRDAVRKHRQRLGLKKEGYRGYFKLK